MKSLRFLGVAGVLGVALTACSASNLPTGFAPGSINQTQGAARHGIGPNGVPHLVEVQGRRFTVELEPFAAIFRYEDLPGMIGRVGTIFGKHGINISSAAVGHTPNGQAAADDGPEGAQRLAAMVVTTDAAVPDAVVEEIVASEGFVDGWSVDLG